MSDHWSVQPSSYRMERDHKPVMLYYDPTPGGKKNADGTTTISLNIPAMALTEWVSEPETIGRQIATELNAFDDVLSALKAVQKLISEAAMTGFNCHDGDWAERLFHSQQATSAAIKKASPLVPSQERQSNG